MTALSRGLASVEGRVLSQSRGEARKPPARVSTRVPCTESAFATYSTLGDKVHTDHRSEGEAEGSIGIRRRERYGTRG